MCFIRSCIISLTTETTNKMYVPKVTEKVLFNPENN